MHDAIWEPPLSRAPHFLVEALPAIPPLVTHLAAWRLRNGRPTADWPDTVQIYNYLYNAETAPLPACRIPRLQQAAERLTLAVQRQEAVGVHGDYDADGVTSAALLTEWLESLGLRVETALPNRFRDGYGLGVAALERLASAGCRLVVAVDCGISSLEAAIRARELGVELIILDHHEPGSALPNVDLLVDPKLPDGSREDHCLAAVGLAYRLCEAMTRCGAGDDGRLATLLDLVALGTIADVCPLTGQNRLLVARGLAALRQANRPGVVALAASAGVRLDRLRAEEVAFRLAPRLNAAGRIADPRVAFDLLRARDAAQAASLAQELERLNRQRQTLTEAAFQAALGQLGSVNGAPKMLIAAGADWHQGVVGLVAGKLTERYHRPAIALTAVGEQYVGSARSIEGFDIARALQDCRDLLVHGGGHARAAGLTIDAAALPPLRVRLETLAARSLTDERMRVHFTAEARVHLKTLTVETLHGIERLGPFGEANPSPLLMAQNAEIVACNATSGGAHTQLRVRQAASAPMRGICFQTAPADVPAVGARVDLLFTPRLDEYQGVERVDLHVEALRLTI